jgi:hypothetical protein
MNLNSWLFRSVKISQNHHATVVLESQLEWTSSWNTKYFQHRCEFWSNVDINTQLLLQRPRKRWLHFRNGWKKISTSYCTIAIPNPAFTSSWTYANMPHSLNVGTTELDSTLLNSYIIIILLKLSPLVIINYIIQFTFKQDFSRGLLYF